MLKLFIFCLLLGGCSKLSDAPKPAASLIGGTWTMESSTEEITPIDGSPRFTYTRTDAAGSTTMVFSDHGEVTYAGRGISTSVGTYTYSGNTLTMTFVSSAVRTITGLTDHRMVAQWHYDHVILGRHDVSDTFTR